MRTERIARTVLIVATTAALAWLVSPLRSAIVWAVVVAVMFRPLCDLLERAMMGHRTLAALATCLVVIATLVLPAIAISGAVFRELSALYGNAADRLPHSISQLRTALPEWLDPVLRLGGIDEPAGLQRGVARLIDGIAAALLGGVLGVGQGALGLALQLGVLIYLSFFLIRDGSEIVAGIRRHLPLAQPACDRVVQTTSVVLRATVRGTLVVAMVQGALGGVIFWLLDIRAALLWGLVMAFTALLPPFGSAVIWAPVAIYLLLTGYIWQGLVLGAAGLFVIGLIDNLLRPLLVGREARLPEYLVLLSTIGGLTLVGFDGIVLGPLIAALCLASWSPEPTVLR